MAERFPGNHLDVDELYILSGLLYAPRPDTTEAIAELAKSWCWLTPAAQDLSCQMQALWQTEHQRLLVGKQALCSPCESAWQQPVLGGTLAALAQYYHQAGIKTQGCPPDHLALQLVYAAWYLEEEAAHDSAQWLEIWSHLSQWVPRFAQCLQQQAQLEVYQVIAQRLIALFARR